MSKPLKSPLKSRALSKTKSKPKLKTSQVNSKRQNSKCEVHEVKSLAEMNHLALEWLSRLRLLDIVILTGPMGAGKTQWVKFIAEHFGNREANSPTFILHQLYKLKKNAKGLAQIDHWDFFRMEKGNELGPAGFWDQFEKNQGLIFIEWGEKFLELLKPVPWNIWQISLSSPHDRGAEFRRVEIKVLGGA